MEQGPAARELRLSSSAATATSSVIRDLLALTERPGMLSLAGGLPAAELLPVARLRAATDRILGAAGDRALQYGATEGASELRGVLADRLDASAGEVLVTTGSQQGIDLLGRVLLDPGDVVVVASPSYLGALHALGATRARIAAVPGDGAGLRTDVLEDRLQAGLRPALVYVVPNFQNPSGATLSEERRTHLAGLSDRYGFVVAEDDPYGELRFAGVPLRPLRGRAELVVSLGTSSKVLAPGLRVGWLTAPPVIRGALVRAKQAADLHTAMLTQLVVADALADEAWFDSHLARLRRVYAERASALAAAVRARLDGLVELTDPQGGMFAWARLLGPAAERGATALLPPAVEAGVAFVPGTAFHAGAAGDEPGTTHPGDDRARLCFATLAPADLEAAVDRLASVVAGPAPAAGDRRTPPSSPEAENAAPATAGGQLLPQVRP